MTKPLILIVEDDPDIASALARGLAREGYQTQVEETFETGLMTLQSGEHSAAIVDVMLGDDSGLELVRTARGSGVAKPILMLSALASVEDRTKGLQAGADDYIVKPFAFEELVARLKVQQARVAASLVVFDQELRQVKGQGQEATLTEREADMLAMLCASSGRPVSRWDIYDNFWPSDGSASENLVDVYIGYLRKKLAAFETVDLKTIRSKGFVLTGITTR